MQLRPLAPLAVIGAGLLAVSLATHSASATTGALDLSSAYGEPLGVDYGSAGSARSTPQLAKSVVLPDADVFTLGGMQSAGPSTPARC